MSQDSRHISQEDASRERDSAKLNVCTITVRKIGECNICFAVETNGADFSVETVRPRLLLSTRGISLGGCKREREWEKERTAVSRVFLFFQV